MPPSDQLRLILVTGASRGIGRALTVALAAAGHHPIALARTQGALEALDDEITAAGGRVTMIPADLTDREAMARLPEALAARFGRLDGFVANAGSLGDLTPIADIQEKMWDRTMALNVTANAFLLTGLDPLLRQSAAGRVVGITSSRARKFKPFWGPYSASKAAFEAVFLTYAAETEESALRVNLVNPGPMRTAMREKAMPGEDPASLPPPAALAPLVLDLLSPEEDRHGQLVTFSA
ncbi:putative oxidoreductase protein [Parvularcula bermudensis HTCC2503]|uniref:Putative oxidoreductase protein n=1 Tax=Parvularcula bermudensis (strain ATCC BAA-594 / HTCC2503 / KCTC 12087) TaxID=314260 RepID=E0TB98_PARBH|nr:SDR family NAD(P)-dependent oxidoreductase [Parvularcula bermudensis]ADM08302.1 putative oxidoreductase protein [Parvularcula bermudensis HTCC2503]